MIYIMFYSCEDMKICCRDMNLFFTLIPWSFVLLDLRVKTLLQMKRNPESIQKEMKHASNHVSGKQMLTQNDSQIPI